METPSDRVVAERAYTDEHEQTWTLQIFEPRISGDSSDALCRFRLLAPDGAEAFTATLAGVDRLQALLLALGVARDVLSAPTEALTFLGSRNLGLPAIEKHEDGP